MTLTTYLPVPTFNVLKFIVITYVWGTIHTKLFEIIENYMVNKEFIGGNAIRVGNRFSLRDRKAPIASGMLGRTMLITLVVGFAAIELAFEFSSDGKLISETKSIRLKVLQVTKKREFVIYRYFGGRFNARLREDLILSGCVKLREMVYYPTEILPELVEKSERNSGVFCPSNYTEGEKVDENVDVGPDEFKKLVKRVKGNISSISGISEVSTGTVEFAEMFVSQNKKAGGLLSTFQDFFTARIEGSSARMTYRNVSGSRRMGYIVDGNITHFGKAEVYEAKQRLVASFSVVSTLRVEKAESDRIIVLDYDDETDGDVRRLKYLRLAAKSVRRLGSNMEEKEIDIAVKVGDRVVATVERWAVIILVTLTVVNLLCMLLIKSVSRGADILDVNDWGGGYVKWLSEKLQLQDCGSQEQDGVFIILENNGAFQHVTVSNADLSVQRDSWKELKGTDPRAIRSRQRRF